MIRILILCFMKLVIVFNVIIRVLLWEVFFLILVGLGVWSFIFCTTNVLALLFHSEFLVMVFFCLLMCASVYSNLNIFFGLAYLFLILGGLELALSVLLLVL